MFRTLTIVAATALLCGSPAFAQGAATATANIVDQSGTALGTITGTEMDGGVHLTGELTGVPNGEHGFHIHAVGKCDAAGKFESAGPHFDVDSHKHGKDNPDGPHAGDLDNLVANDDGKVTVDFHVPNANLAALNDADGASLVIHADPDDYKTDPSGNSGERFACGVIEFSK
ncbi:MAG TPA: superoxide dismutase family protein [Devosia sp.]|nr:superoxide dismutase family protein [Devosia sp.]